MSPMSDHGGWSLENGVQLFHRACNERFFCKYDRPNAIRDFGQSSCRFWNW